MLNQYPVALIQANDARPRRKKVDLIYDTTPVCPWDCAVCCVDTLLVKKLGHELQIRSHGLDKIETFPLDKNYPNIYAQAPATRAARGEELDLSGKLSLIDNLRDFDARIDISGGDTLNLPENLGSLRYAADKLGCHHITLTVTSAASAEVSIEKIIPYISECNFNFDAEFNLLY